MCKKHGEPIKYYINEVALKQQKRERTRKNATLHAFLMSRMNVSFMTSKIINLF